MYELHNGYKVGESVVLDVGYGLKALVESDFAYLDGFLHHVHYFVVKYAQVKTDCELE